MYAYTRTLSVKLRTFELPILHCVPVRGLGSCCTLAEKDFGLGRGGGGGGGVLFSLSLHTDFFLLVEVVVVVVSLTG